MWHWKDRGRTIAQVGLGVFSIALIVVMLLNPEEVFLQKSTVYALFAITTMNFALVACRPSALLGLPGTAFARRVLTYLLVILMAIEISSGVYYVLRSFDPATSIGKMDAGIELQLSYASYGLLPWLYLAFLFSWAWVPTIQRLLLRTRTSRPDLGESPEASVQSFTESLGTGHLSAFLDPGVFAMLAVAVLIGYYPYFQAPPWFAQALRERHPVTLALFYAAQVVFRTTAFEVVRFAPLVLVVVSAFAAWWFLARRKPISFGLTVALFSVLSVVTTVGMYSSILANWMAYVVWMLFFGYVAFRGDAQFRVLDTVPLLLMSTLILFIHPWSWGVFAASVLLFAVLTLVQEKRRGLKPAALLVLVVVVDIVIAFLSLAVLGESQGWRVAEAFGDYLVVVRNPASVLVFWDALTRLTQVWAAFFSPLSIVVSILGVFCLQKANLSGSRRRLVLCWLCVSAIGSILVAPVGFNPSEPIRSESQLWRLLFLTPFQLTLPLGAALLADLPRRLNRARGSLPGPKSGLRPHRRIFFAAVSACGFLLAWMPLQVRSVLILILLPVITGVAIAKSAGGDDEILSDVVLSCILLVAFTYTTRALAQLLISPHNYTP
jgi:hypothetical protein